MKLKEVINYYSRKYAPTIDGEEPNLLPMNQFALFELNAPLEAIEAYSLDYCQAYNLKRCPLSPYTISHLSDGLGHPYTYFAYIDYFDGLSQSKGIDEVIRLTLNAYPEGLHSSGFHALSRLAFGVLSDNYEEKLRGLAYYLSSYERLPQPHRTIPHLAMNGLIDRLIADKQFEKRQHLALPFPLKFANLLSDPAYVPYLIGMTGEPLEKMTCLVKLINQHYLASGNPMILQLLLGFHALSALNEFYDDFDVVLNYFTTAAVAYFLLGKDSLEPPVHFLATAYNNRHFNELFVLAIDSKKAYAPLVTYAAYQLYTWFKQPQLTDTIAYYLL